MSKKYSLKDVQHAIKADESLEKGACLDGEIQYQLSISRMSELVRSGQIKSREYEILKALTDEYEQTVYGIDLKTPMEKILELMNQECISTNDIKKARGEDVEEEQEKESK